MKSPSRDFFVTYRWDDGSSLSPMRAQNQEWHCYTREPVIALNIFHREMQRKAVRSVQDRKIILRPRLKPDQYKIIRMYLKYADNDGRTIESEFDMPDTANPNAKPQKKQKTETMSLNLD